MPPRFHATPLEAVRETIRETVYLDGHTFQIERPVDPDALFDHPWVRSAYAADTYTPYWAALWPSARMLACTRALVVAEMARLPLSTYDTVLVDTPAWRATSAIVTTLSRADRRGLPLVGGTVSLLSRSFMPGRRPHRGSGGPQPCRVRSCESQLADDDARRVADQV